ncbi:MAG: hypothetical protein A3B90_02820 [Candidatus Magasanikbacteria bacterium RIFCSPHIGHO2_02_FULL_41_13]|uniref:Putative pre-16S rRNA nuclease n=1 Tax=Candidatus Magasanikbacteria bacterium RIFCSPHIGHO2_02_FULL_41_13 TaxID=1798676 RepID=A0A1F6M3R9_9BACT|nr:MAG: hypothetical protein A3B90_02820 [Candidatus Magasanikbacteria bacterium RIFCSPHIGHO2_02_FULL_41_13]
MNILGVDYGTKRIGLAWMQPGLDVVLPFGIIQTEEREEQLKDLVKLIQEEKIDVVVVGLPLELETGKETVNTKRVREFAMELQKRCSVKVEFVDERLSSFEADQMGGEASRDEKAAMVILETYAGNRADKT